MTVLLSPIFNLPFITDNAGNPLSGGKIFAYEAGSFSVLVDTFTSAAGDVANTNPIVLNSSGQLDGVAIWLTAGQAYNLVLTQADGTTVLKSFDDVVGIGASSSGGGTGSAVIWVNTPGASYLAPTQFLVPSNETEGYAVGNRARVSVAGGYRYGTVTAVSFSSPNTTVTLALDSGSLDASVADADYSVLIASGRTVDAGAVSYFDSLPYVTTNTVGWKIRTAVETLTANINAVDARLTRDEQVQVTTSSVSVGNTLYALTLSPVGTALSTNEIFVVKFNATAVGSPTLNISGLGAKALKSYDSSASLVTPTIVAGMLSQVAYDEANNCYIVLDTLPGASVAAPHGWQNFTSSGTFTVPSNVYYIKVTCVGGGGAGAEGITMSGGDSSDVSQAGGGGGGGAVVSDYISTTPGTSYSVTIGGGGTVYPSANGGTSTFGITLVTAVGGSAGSSPSSVYSPGAGGAGGASGNGFVVPGSPGFGMSGGFAPGFGGVGSLYGGGGAGTANGYDAPGVGRPGLVRVEW